MISKDMSATLKKRVLCIGGTKAMHAIAGDFGDAEPECTDDVNNILSSYNMVLLKKVHDSVVACNGTVNPDLHQAIGDSLYDVVVAIFGVGIMYERGRNDAKFMKEIKFEAEERPLEEIDEDMLRIEKLKSQKSDESTATPEQ
jgi:hypothetical protein